MHQAFIDHDWPTQEVPDYFQLGDKHYIVFCSVRSRKSDTSGRKDASGTWYVMADRREGPYHLPSRPLLLGSGRGRHDHYVGRTLTYQGKRLLYHQTWGNGPVTWGTLKVVHQNQDGSLGLRYWSGLNALTTKTLLKEERFALQAPRDARTLRMFNIAAADLMLTCTLDLGKAKAAALIWRSEQKGGREFAAGLLIDARTDTVSMVGVEYWKTSLRAFNANTILTHLKDDYHEKGIAQGSIQVRILIRAHLAEVYVDDTWLFCTDVTDMPAQGDVGLMAESGEVVVTDLEVKELEPLGSN